MQRSAGAIALFLLVLLGVLVVIPGHTELSATEGDSTIRFTVDRTRVLSRAACISAAWDAANIREIYINGEPTVGTAERKFCGVPPVITLHILFPSGEAKDYSVSTLAMENNGWFWLGLVAIVGLLLYALHGRVHGKPLRTAFWSGLHWLQRHPAVTLALITLLGAALRLYHLTYESLWLDETMLLHIAGQPSLEAVTLVNASQNSAPPLFAWLLSAVLPLSTSEAAVRGIPLVAGILVIPCSYALARQYAPRVPALLVAVLFAVAPSQVRYSQEVREYSLAVLLAIGVLWSFNAYRARPTLARWAVLTVVFVVALFTQYGLALFILALNGVFLVAFISQKPRRPKRLAAWLASQSLVALGAVAVVGLSLGQQWMSGGFAGAGYLASAYGDGTPGSLLRLLVETTLEVVHFIYPGDLFLLLVLAGLGVYLARKRRINGMTLWLVIVVTLLAAFLRFYPYLGGRQDIFLTVPLLILGGAGYRLFRAYVRRESLRVLLVIVLVASGLVASLDQANTLGPRQTRQAMQQIQDHFQPGDRIYVHGYALGTYDYYRAQGLMAGLPDPIPGSSPHGDGYMAEVPGLLAEDGRIWMLIAECSEICLQSYSEAIAPLRSFGWEFDTGDTGLLLVQ